MVEPAVERERLLALGFVECRDCARCVEKAAIEAGAEAGESGEDVECGAGERCAEVLVRADNHAYRLAGLDDKLLKLNPKENHLEMSSIFCVPYYSPTGYLYYYYNICNRFILFYILEFVF